MPKRILLILILILFFGKIYSQETKRNSFTIGIPIVFFNSKLSKTEFGQTIYDEPRYYAKLGVMASYKKRFSKNFSLYTELRYVDFSWKDGSSFTFDNNGKKILYIYDDSFEIDEFNLNLSTELNQDFIPFIYFKSGIGLGLNFFSNTSDNAYKEIKGLDGDFVRVAKVNIKNTTKTCFLYHIGFGVYLYRNEVGIKTGFDLIYKNEIDMGFENLKFVNRESEIFLQMEYEF